MKNTILGCIVAAMMFTGCKAESWHGVISNNEAPSGEIVTTTFNYGKITGISTSAGIKVCYTYADHSSPVEVQAYENMMKALEITVDSKGVLHCGFKDGKNFRFKDKEAPVVNVVSPAVSYFSASSGSEIEAKNAVEANGSVRVSASSGADIEIAGLVAKELEVSCSSGAEIEIENIAADRVSASSSSGSDISLSGRTPVAKLSASSGSDIHAAGLKAESGSASASSGGSVKSAINNAEVTKSSGGSVKNRI